MKKLIAVLMAIAMIAALSVTAFAATITELADQTIEVNGTFVGYTQEDEYNLTIGWGDMEFTYAQATQQWDEVNHKWIAKDAAAWTAEGNTITLKNDSSAAVEAEFTFDTEVEDLVAEFTCDTDNVFAEDVLTMAVAAADQEAATYTVTMTLSGDVEFADGVIGEIIVALS